MKGVCPNCGFVSELLGFLVDVEAREAMEAALASAPPLGPLITRYLGLFRPRERALQLKRIDRLLRELGATIASGKVRRHGRDWPAPLPLWREALDAVLDSRDTLTLPLPLKDHHYLYEVVARLANRTEAAAETRVEESRRLGTHREPAPATPATALNPAQAAAAELAARMKGDAKGS